MILNYSIPYDEEFEEEQLLQWNEKDSLEQAGEGEGYFMKDLCSCSCKLPMKSTQDYWKVSNATNNICELSAVLGACAFFDAYTSKENTATIYSDSSYIINCITQKWYKKWQTNGWRNSKKEPVANRELWERLIPYFENPRFSFEKVKGHSGEKDWNDYVDKLAVEAKKIKV